MKCLENCGLPDQENHCFDVMNIPRRGQLIAWAGSKMVCSTHEVCGEPNSGSTLYNENVSRV